MFPPAGIVDISLFSVSLGSFFCFKSVVLVVQINGDSKVGGA